MKQRVVVAIAALLMVIDVLMIARAVALNPGWYDTTDFGLYLKAAGALAAGENPYAIRIEVDHVVHGYAYPPVFALTLMPSLLVLGPEATRLLWVVVTLGFVVASLVLLLRAFGPPLAWHWVLLILGIACATRIIRNEVYHGQADLPVMLLIVLGLFFLSRSHEGRAGLFLGMAMVVKPFLGVLALWLFWRGMRRASVLTFATSGALFVLSFLPAGLNAATLFWDWRASSQYALAVPFVVYPDNHALYGLVTRLFVETPFAEPWLVSRTMRDAAMVLVLLGMFAVVMRTLPPRQSRPAELADARVLLAEAGAALGLAMAMGPLLEGGYLLYLVPGLVGTLRLALAADTPNRRVWWWAAAAWSVLLVGMLSPVQFGTLTEPIWVPPVATGLSVLLTWRVGALVLVSALLTCYALAVSRAAPAPLLRSAWDEHDDALSVFPGQDGRYGRIIPISSRR